MPAVEAAFDVAAIDVKAFFRGSSFAEEMGGIVFGRIEVTGNGTIAGADTGCR